ncbi:hypothetical protein ARMGADRAFT_1079812 [Armillaria gallica]|uniref:Uncharacterized protein n=1 Tax=Armillaria gallica TaxID=47427 RepID=A0A2H3DPW0_ARMGA|nr:hypothetical protein ARMGADRAFT_1079812 [Armillaria gallica]
MAKLSRSKLGNRNKTKKGEGKVNTTEPQVEGEEEEAAPRIDLTSRLPKVPVEVKKPHLTFMVRQATDSERIYDGEADGEYSIDNPNKEMVPYDLEALLLSRQLSVDYNQTEEEMDILPKTDAPTTSKSLFGKGFVPVEGFCANSAFDSLRGSPTTKGTTAPIDGSWHRGPPLPPPCPVTITDDISSSEDKDEDEDVEDNDNKNGGIDARAETVAPTRQNRPQAITPMNMGNSQAQEIIPKQISQEMVDQDATIARVVLDEFLENTTKVKEAMRDQLAGMAYSQRSVLREIAHTQTAKVFECLGFTNIDKNFNEYIRQYNTEILTVLLGRDIRKLEEGTIKKELNAKQLTMVMPEGRMFLTFEEQRAKI